MDQKGASYLIQWLEPLAANVYPNVNLQQGVLECLDKLNVQPPDVEDKVIYEVLNEYVRAREVSQPIRRMAMNLRDKWEHLKSQRANAQGYDQDEAEEEDEETGQIISKNDKYEQYRRLQAKLELFRRIRIQQLLLQEGSGAEEEPEEEEVLLHDEQAGMNKRQKLDAFLMPPPPQNRAGELEMTRDGMRLPERNAFDFVRAPSKDAFRKFQEKRSSSTKGKESGRQLIQRALLNLKRKKNMSTVGNKNMNLVKASDDL